MINRRIERNAALEVAFTPMSERSFTPEILFHRLEINTFERVSRESRLRCSQEPVVLQSFSTKGVNPCTVVQSDLDAFTEVGFFSHSSTHVDSANLENVLLFGERQFEGVLVSFFERLHCNQLANATSITPLIVVLFTPSCEKSVDLLFRLLLSSQLFIPQLLLIDQTEKLEVETYSALNGLGCLAPAGMLGS